MLFGDGFRNLSASKLEHFGIIFTASRGNIWLQSAQSYMLQGLQIRLYFFCLLDYLKERNFRMDLFSRVIFSNSCEFNFANWLLVDFLRGFIFANQYFRFISVLYILIFSWFVLQLVLCESRNSYPSYSIFQKALFGYTRLNSRFNA